MNSTLQFHRPNRDYEKLIESLNRTYHPLADTTYGTLLTWWDLYDDLMFAELCGNVIVQSSYMTNGRDPAYSVIGAHNIDETIQEIFTYQSQINIPRELHYVPEYAVEFLDDLSNFIVEEKPDIAEYVLSAEQHTNLKGKEFIHLHRKVNRFENVHGKASIHCKELPLDNFRIQQLLINSLHTWQNDFKNDRNRQEGYIIDQSIRLANTINLTCLGIFMDDTLIGFALYKLLPKGYADINHIKVCYEFKGIFLYALHLLARHLLSLGITHLNIEQDLGIGGLRTFKQRLHPVKMLKKYTIKPA